MQINDSPEPNIIPRINAPLIRDKRLRFLENEQLPNEIVNVIGLEHPQTRDVSIKAKKFSKNNLFHRIELLLKISIKVDLQGETILINYRSIRNNTYANKHQIKLEKNRNQLIQFIALSIAIKKFGTSQLQSAALETMREKSFINLSRLHRGDMEILVGANEQGDIEVLRLGQTIAKGGFGKVVKVDNLTTGQAEVIKSGLKRKGQLGVDDVSNEYRKDAQIFGNRKPWGFRIRLKQMTKMHIKAKHGKTQPSQFTREKVVTRNERYDADYLKDIKDNPNRSFETLLPDFHQMFYTLHYMEAMKMTHGDIKPQNFLVKMVNGVKLVHLADLGDMICFNDLKPHQRIKLSTSGTTVYTIKREGDLFVDHYRHQHDLEGFEFVQGKRDVFAMGATMYQALTGKLPYEVVKKRGTSYAPKDFTYVDIENVPPAFNELLKQMLDPNAETRIGRSDAWHAFSQIIAQYPAIRQKILTDIETLGYDQTEI